MRRAIRAAEALRGSQCRLVPRGAHRETQIAQEAVRELGVRRHALVIDAADLRPHARLPALRDGGDGFDDSAECIDGRYQAYAEALYTDPSATLHDLREALTTFEDMARIARRVFGGAHPTTAGIERHLRNARAILSIHEHAPTCVAIFAAAALALAAAYLARKKLT